MNGGGSVHGRWPGSGVMSCQSDTVVSPPMPSWCTVELPALCVRCSRPAEGTIDWHAAELVGKKSTDVIWRLLNAAEWAEDRGRDSRCASIAAHLEDPEAVIVRDEADVVQPGRHSSGVSPSYSGTVA